MSHKQQLKMTNMRLLFSCCSVSILLMLFATQEVSSTVGHNGIVTIEIRLERVEDPLGIRDDGRRCDVFSDCDMRVKINVDTESYNQSWPGAKEVSQWYMIDLPGDTNMVTVMKTLLARRSENEYHDDQEGKVLVNFRVNVEDRNFWTANRLIERFNCLFSGIPSNSSSEAQWTPPLEQDPMQCHGEIHFARPPAERPTVYYRWRIFKTEIPTQQHVDAAVNAQRETVFSTTTTAASSSNQLAASDRAKMWVKVTDPADVLHE